MKQDSRYDRLMDDTTVLNQEEFLRVSLPDYKGSSPADLSPRISNLSIPDLQEFERIAKIKYFSYPERYRR